MNVIAECSFREFNGSPFLEEFGKMNEDGSFVFETPGVKMVLGIEEYDYGHCISAFYRRSPSGRWIKKLEVSDDQLFDDCTVYLMGDNQTEDPEAILFDMGSTTFEYTLTNDMVRALRQAYEDSIQDYFPNYEVAESPWSWT